MTEPVNLDNITIPVVDLDLYRFSPPGSMGWSEAEYEQLITDPERTIQTDTFSPPRVPQTEWTELSVSEDRVDSVLPEKEEIDTDKTGTAVPANEVPDTETAEIAPSSDEPKEDFIQTPNPPARPWLASQPRQWD